MPTPLFWMEWAARSATEADPYPMSMCYPRPDLGFFAVGRGHGGGAQQMLRGRHFEMLVDEVFARTGLGPARRTPGERDDDTRGLAALLRTRPDGNPARPQFETQQRALQRVAQIEQRLTAAATPPAPSDRLRRWIAELDLEVTRLGTGWYYLAAGAEVAAVLVDPSAGHLLITAVGFCRAYAIEANSCRQLTQDESLGAIYRAHGLPAQGGDDLLVRALGCGDPVEPYQLVIQPLPRDRSPFGIALLTDGVHGRFVPDELERLLIDVLSATATTLPEKVDRIWSAAEANARTPGERHKLLTSGAVLLISPSAFAVGP